MSNLDNIIRAKYVSGEMFDLTAASFNNTFGAKHNKCIIQHGINFPLSKFIKELELIIATNVDDKTIKRQHRLDFLLSCNKSNEVQELFYLFSNFLNGGGAKSSRTKWAMQQYYNNFFVITAAGGNIIILLSQLLANMIDVFKCKVNAATSAAYDGSATDNWDIHKPNFESQDFETDTAFNMAKTMFSTPYDSWSQDFWDIITGTFASLLQMNKVLLMALDKIRDIDKDVLCFIIVKYFIEEDIKDGFTLEKLWEVALSDISDFDFKLSPNVHPRFSGKPEYESVDELTSSFARLEMGADEAVNSLFRELISNIRPDDSGGFLLFRVKTLIDCRNEYVQEYTGKELKTFQRNCARSPPDGLGKMVWGLYPQIMQQAYLDAVDPTSDCWKYLNHLNEKKRAIRDATQNSIDETMKFFQAGYFKPANSLGELFPLVDPAQNSTEAIINYISNITFHINKYIEKWEKLDEDGKHVLSSDAAPGLHQGGLPPRFSYASACLNFLSLDSILNHDNGLVSRLAADILNYFLNSPYFHTEAILDSLIESFKSKRTRLTGTTSDAFMPPSDLLAVPTNRKFNASLRNIKTILEGPQYSELGYPDGIRITLNAIETTDLIGDTNLDVVEDVFQTRHRRDKSIETAYTPLGRGLNKQLRVKRRKVTQNAKKNAKKSRRKLNLKIK